ncbi:MAG: acetyl/propionyl/methylcrotonyl-CoA carboxylase subunit alpha [Pseudomonadota bacterium]
MNDRLTKILIANRGEIACRVIRTARSIGVSTVAVYSEADAGALHVEMADEAVLIGPAPVSESYLKADRIVEAALATGAQAIHPGYGFLSENPEFVEKIEAAGLTFIGPPADAIRAMGLKDAAKKAMEAAGVPVVPGYHGEAQDVPFLAEKAGEIGYPVLIKARAGGGGKGMRRVDDLADFADALAGAQREGEASFGDPRVLIEKYVATPRHIEIQVFGDSHGNIVHLHERDCSLQRRHQKVIEEAPAPGMTPEMRAAMGGAAVKAAQAIGYQGAGTIEFIVDASDGLQENAFYFMEMNTRLQVEHPVTEAITGLDLVEWQLRVAAGEPLPLTQEEIPLTGHAFEARIYAEDPVREFLPATGTLEHLRFPPGTRADTGVRAGDAITPFYDPMIAKLITHGPTREVALGQLSAALRETEIAGSVTNLRFLQALSAHPGFAAGEVDTGLIGRDYEALLAADQPEPLAPAIAAMAALRLDDPVAGPFSGLGAWRLWGLASAGVTLELNGQARVFDLSIDGGFAAVRDAENTWEIKLLSAGETWVVETASGRVSAKAVRHRGRVTTFIAGRADTFTIVDPLAAAAALGASGDQIIAPMSGLVKLVSGTVGQTVAAGEPLLVLEAMKMEHTLTAPRDGVVEEILAATGQQVAEGAVLVTLASEETGAA